MLTNKNGYATLHRLAQYGKSYYKRLIKNARQVNTVYKKQNYYEQYFSNITMTLWKLEKELKKKNIKYGKGFSTIGTNYEVITRTRNSGSTAWDIFADEEFFIPEINCLPEEITYEYYDEQDNLEEFDAEYLKAFFALQDGDIVFLMSVFTSTLLELMKYIEKNYEMLIQDIENGLLNPNIKIPDDMREDLAFHIVPNPKRAEELRKVFEETSEEPIIPRIWKKLSMIATFSLGESSVYEDKLKKYSGQDILYVHQMYASGKTLIATVFDEKEKNYLLCYDSRIL